MSSNGSIPPNMNPAPSGAFGLRARANGRAPFAASLLYLAGCAARCANNLHMRAFLIVGAYEIS